MKYQVIKSHQPSDPDGLEAKAGERLAYERRPTAFAGWLWCRHTDGRESWAPEAWLRLEGQEAVLLRDYSAKELSISPGEMVTVELQQSEWALVVTEAGERGWLPAACLQQMG